MKIKRKGLIVADFGENKWDYGRFGVNVLVFLCQIFGVGKSANTLDELAKADRLNSLWD